MRFEASLQEVVCFKVSVCPLVRSVRSLLPLPLAPWQQVPNWLIIYYPGD